MAVRAKNHRDGDAGFSLIEVMMSSAILAIGLLGVLSLFVNALATMHYAQEELIAKQKAKEALESIYGARNTQQITFDRVANTGTGGIFLDGFQPLRLPGPDGLVGTADDTAVEELVYPGADELLGTGDDERRPLNNFERQIEIVPVARPDGSANLDVKQLTITIRYTTPNFGQRTYTVGTYISRYR